MYTEINFKSKKALKEAVKAGKEIRVFRPGLGGPGPINGKVYLEGPHYPEPHKWYASGVANNGTLVSVS